MTRFASLLYGAAAYGASMVTVLYAIGFVANSGVPKGIDEGAVVPLAEALVVNTLLLALFAVQHSVMARPGFKAWWTKVVPEPIERSTFVAFASLSLISPPSGPPALHRLHGGPQAGAPPCRTRNQL